MSTIDILRAQVREVAQRRAERDALAAELKDARAAFEATLGDKPARLKGLVEAVAMSEDAAKKLGEALHAATKNKAPVDGLSIKEMNVYSYSKSDAFAWAKEKGLALIPESLDVAAFEKIAKATPLPFVTHTVEGKAQLASDLSAYLAPAPSDAAPLTPQELSEVPF